MNKPLMYLAALLGALLLFGALDSILVRSHAAQSSSSALGVWLTQSGNLEIDIAPCAAALCGTVARVLANRSMSKPDVEMKSADARSPLGMTILSDFTPSGAGTWQGRIYNRENGKYYDCRMRVVAPDRLEIRAYKLLPIFGKTQIWTRVSAGARS